MAESGRFFDRFVRRSGRFRSLRRPRLAARSPRRFERLAAPGGVDASCSISDAEPGQSLQVYSDRSAGLRRIDLSFQALTLARRTLPGRRWERGRRLPASVRGPSFDAVAFSSVLHHIPDFRPALREAMRVLAPGGSVFAFDPNLLHPAMAPVRWPKSPFYSPTGSAPTRRRSCRSSCVGRSPPPASPSPSAVPVGHSLPAVAPRLINACLSLYNAADWAFERIGLGRWFGTFVLTAARKPAGEPRNDFERAGVPVPRRATRLSFPFTTKRRTSSPFCARARRELPPGYELLVCYDFEED